MSLMKWALWCWPSDRWLPAFVSLPERFLRQSEPAMTELSRPDVPGDALRLSVTAVGWCINTIAPCPLGGKLCGACPTLNPRVPKRRGLSGHSQQRLDAPLQSLPSFPCLTPTFPYPVSWDHLPHKLLANESSSKKDANSKHWQCGRFLRKMSLLV